MRFTFKLCPTIALLLLPLIMHFEQPGTLFICSYLFATGVIAFSVSLSKLVPKKKPCKLKIHSIIVSHYCEKVRWCLDYLNIPYIEEFDAAVLGLTFLGRSVPSMTIDRKEDSLHIVGSDKILRYIYGNYKHEFENNIKFDYFLNPNKEAIEFESFLNLFGRSVQIWCYYTLLTTKEAKPFLLIAWGKDAKYIPIWQRILLIILYPVLKLFLMKMLIVNEKFLSKAFDNINDTFDLIETKLFENYKKRLALLIENKNKNKNNEKKNINGRVNYNCKFEDVRDELGKNENLFLLSHNKFSYIDVTFASLAYPIVLGVNNGVEYFAKGKSDIVNKLINPEMFKDYCPQVYDQMIKLRKRPAAQFVRRIYKQHRDKTIQ